MDLSISPSFQGSLLDTSPEAFGSLRSSSDALSDIKELRWRFEQDGYLYLPGLLDRNQVLAARLEMLRKLEAAGCLDPDYPMEDGDDGDRWNRRILRRIRGY